jgi:hypothetical protein
MVFQGKQNLSMETSSLPAKVIEQIQRRHAEGKPLNITAVKRDSPNLIRAVYSIPQMSWKEALGTAGMDYQTIKIELRQTCACQLCGKEAENLGRHLQVTHKLTASQYRKKFPQAEIASETIRARIGMRRDAPLPHSEPIWSPEYCLDRLREYHRHGLRMTFWSVNRMEKGFTAATIHYFGSWAEALRQAGFDPDDDEFTVKRKSWNEKPIREALLERQRRGRPMNFGAVWSEDTSLIQAVTRHFGSYANALRRAGIDPLEVRKRPFAYSAHDKRLFMEEVRRVAQLKGVDRFQAVNRLHKQFEKIVSNNFRSWKKVAAIARIEPRYLSKGRFPDAETVLDWVAQWVTQGRELKASVIQAKDVGLYKAILRYFGSFENMRQRLRTKPLWAKR